MRLSCSVTLNVEFRSCTLSFCLSRSVDAIIFRALRPYSSHQTTPLRRLSLGFSSCAHDFWTLFPVTPDPARGSAIPQTVRFLPAPVHRGASKPNPPFPLRFSLIERLLSLYAMDERAGEISPLLASSSAAGRLTVKGIRFPPPLIRVFGSFRFLWWALIVVQSIGFFWIFRVPPPPVLRPSFSFAQDPNPKECAAS